jgi:hypothetical protein
MGSSQRQHHPAADRAAHNHRPVQVKHAAEGPNRLDVSFQRELVLVIVEAGGGLDLPCQG